MKYIIWTYDKCKEEALKHKTRSAFSKYSGSAYNHARKNNFLDEISSHMIQNHKHSRYWTFKKCKEEALKYNNKKSFNEKSASCYVIALRNGWMDEISSHMKIVGNRYNKCIYVYEFSDNHAYVGLTYNINERQRNRNNDITDAVTKHIKENKLLPIRKKLTKYIPVDEAVKLEEYYYKEYKENGWIMLNKAKTGAVGGGIIKWTKDMCIKVAMLSKNRGEFYKKYRCAYLSSLKNGWMSNIYIIFKMKENEVFEYKKKVCEKNAKKYITKKEFKKNYDNDYRYAYKNGFLNDICEHMIYIRLKTLII